MAPVARSVHGNTSSNETEYRPCFHKVDVSALACLLFVGSVLLPTELTVKLGLAAHFGFFPLECTVGR